MGILLGDKRMRIKDNKIWLSARDTYNWAHRPGANWPCSQLAGHRVFAEFADNGDLIDYAIDGRIKDVDTNEFNAIMGDQRMKQIVFYQVIGFYPGTENVQSYCTTNYCLAKTRADYLSESSLTMEVLHVEQEILKLVLQPWKL